jgi:hypothetical protein
VWAHPDLLPTAADLDDPLAFAQRTKAADDIDISSPDFDAALSALLDQGSSSSESAESTEFTESVDDPETPGPAADDGQGDANGEDREDNPPGIA